MEFALDYAGLAKKLESQELESPSGRASPQVYGQLLAIYLLFNDLTSAKFLWKRIANEVKDENIELSVIWTVGKLMWKKNYAEIYSVISSWPAWPNHLNNIMNLIIASTRKRGIDLILRAYSSINLADASRLLGLGQEETIKLAQRLKWTYEERTGYLLINKSDISQREMSDSSPVLGLDSGAELLDKLTDYIMFLEVVDKPKR